MITLMIRYTTTQHSPSIVKQILINTVIAKALLLLLSLPIKPAPFSDILVQLQFGFHSHFAWCQNDWLVIDILEFIDVTTFSIFVDTFSALHPGQNGRHFADDSFKHIFMNENFVFRFEFLLKSFPIV